VSADIHELLALHALDMLDDNEVKVVNAAIAADPRLEAELTALRDATHQLGAMSTVAPSPDVEAQLLASIGGGRLERFAAQMSKIFDVTVDRARELFGITERASAWDIRLPGIGLIHFDGGPACATADCGFIRIMPGGTFPWHTHRGDELSLIVAGTLRDHDGKLYRPGDELFHPGGSSHELTVAGDEPVIFIARAFDGIEVAGVRQA
jgi:putative transcriptional regulator